MIKDVASDVNSVFVRLKRTASMPKHVARKLAFDEARDQGIDIQSPRDVKIVSDVPKGINRALIFKPNPAGGLSIFA